MHPLKVALIDLTYRYLYIMLVQTGGLAVRGVHPYIRIALMHTIEK